MGALIANSCDLDAVLALAGRAPALTGPPWDPAAALPPGPAGSNPVTPVVAVAAGAAFTFGYTEQAELLEAAGSRVALFDPLRDEDLPEGTGGLILGGGFPEVHAAALSANERLRQRVAALVGRSAPGTSGAPGPSAAPGTLEASAASGAVAASGALA